MKCLIQLGDATPFLYAFAMSMLGIKNEICAFVLFRYNKKKKISHIKGSLYRYIYFEVLFYIVFI